LTSVMLFFMPECMFLSLLSFSNLCE
jgi:hypothetical protein